MSQPLVVSAAVEGLLDEAVARRLVEEAGGVLGNVHGKRGKASLHQSIAGFNSAAHRFPWVVLVDLDHDADCAPMLQRSWLPNLAPGMCFRIAVRAIEAWLLADRQGLSKFLGVAISRVPAQPEALADPKRAIVELARYSRKRDIREDMVPRSGSGRPVGPAYTSRLIEFVTQPEYGWRPDVAAACSQSLNRCLRSLHGLVERHS